MKTAYNTVIFDLGGVLIDWNPHYVYRHIFPDTEKMHWFFENVCTSDWNESQDAGRPLQEATEELVAKYPEYENEVRAYYGRWEEMLGGPIEGTVNIFRSLKESGRFSFYALTNWSAETFPVALRRYPFLSWFQGIVMSGEERTRKPFPEIYNILLNRYQVNAPEAIFIDDSLRNIKGAQAVGITGVHFQSPQQLQSELQQYGML